jgi:antirestriction protein ArdC
MPSVLLPPDKLSLHYGTPGAAPIQLHQRFGFDHALPERHTITNSLAPSASHAPARWHVAALERAMPPLQRYPTTIFDFFRRPQHGVKGVRQKISPSGEHYERGTHHERFETITQQIIDQLEQGTVPWRLPWRTRIVPCNLLSSKPYRGINVWLLLSRPYASAYWLTFRQANEIGGIVRKGEKGTAIVLWQFPDDRTAEDTDLQRDRKHAAPLVRAYTVFNTEQCCLPQSLTERFVEPETHPVEPITACENIIAHMPNRPTIEHGGDRAYYLPAMDTVTVPQRARFVSLEAYYATVFHEIAHSTGHATRLARPTIVDTAAFASHAYCKEELTAEFSSAFLCGYCGIAPQTLVNATAYIAHWVEKLQKDKVLVIQAAGQAQRAVDFILNTTPADDVNA